MMSKPRSHRRKRPSSKAKMGNGFKRFKYKESVVRQQLNELVVNIERWFSDDGSGDNPSERSKLHSNKGEG